ncbi:unnamed protein product [Gongylonema pulchrum]|uniref:Uncharacterized protein n=1 Tax=Gongylonema pulchrum TaxID=637853 RepID=A0A183CWQ7_9BILA|nr:unnamed protein product [Gongylonema pulchrum]
MEMDSHSDLKPIVPLAAAAAAGSLMLTNCDQSPLGKLMEQYNRLASESRIATTAEEKFSKKDVKPAETIGATAAGAAALVDTMPYSNTVYSPYSWPAATASPWWSAEPTGTWPPLPYPTPVATDTTAASYTPYLGSQFQGLLSAATVSAATVSAVGQAATRSNSGSSSTNEYLLNPLSKIPGGNAVSHSGGGKMPTRSNCECPNCQEAERLGNCFY